MINLNRALMVGALVAVAAGASAAPSIVYQNLTTVTAASYRMASGAGSSLEFGDQVALAGTDRRIRNIRTVLQVQRNGLGNYDFDVAIRFRNLDGTAGAPNTIIGTPLNYQIRGLSEGTTGTAVAYFFNFGVADILVPDNLLVSYQFTRVGGNTGGVGVQFTNDAAEVGASDVNFFWRETAAGTAATGGWSQVNFGAAPTTNANIVQEFTAVPEPATMAALGLGVAAMLRRRSKKA